MSTELDYALDKKREVETELQRTQEKLKHVRRQITQLPAGARFQAACAALSGMIARDGGSVYPNAEWAVKQADALLDELAKAKA